MPLLISYPKRIKPRRVSGNVSSMDLLPTLAELVGTAVNYEYIDGKSLVPYLYGSKEPNSTVVGEYAGEGSITPTMMLKRGNWKFIICSADPYQLYDLSTDPRELENLAIQPRNDSDRLILQQFIVEAHERWDLPKIHREVLKSQRQRRLCWSALTRGRFESWDYQPLDDAKEK